MGSNIHKKINKNKEKREINQKREIKYVTPNFNVVRIHTLKIINKQNNLYVLVLGALTKTTDREINTELCCLYA